MKSDDRWRSKSAAVWYNFNVSIRSEDANEKTKVDKKVATLKTALSTLTGQRVLHCRFAGGEARRRSFLGG
jgi:hypothetical protein